MEIEKERVRQMMENLTLRQIYTFFRVVEYENLTRAAQELNLTQAAVSRMIASMEKELHLILFVRTVRGTVPTPAAKMLYENWRKALRAMEGSYEAAYRAQLGCIQNFYLGAVYFEQDLTHHAALADWFEGRYPQIGLRIEYKVAEALREELISGKYQAVLVNGLEADSLKENGVSFRRVARMPCSIYLYETNPLYQKEDVSLSDLKNGKLIFIGSREIARSRAVMDFCRRYGLTAENLLFESDYKTALIMFLRGEGALLSEGMLSRLPAGKCRCLPVPQFDSGLVLAWSGELSPVLRELAGFIEEQLQKS